MPKQFLSCLFVLLCAAASAQDIISDTSFIAEARNTAINSYYRYTGRQARLYNGIEHPGYLSSIKGTAYFVNDSLIRGAVVYDGLLFEDVPMIYDLYKDELIILHYSGLRITLLSEKISSFDFRGHQFKRHVYDSLATVSLPTGFYDYIYSGKDTVLVKRTIRLEEKVTDIIIREFFPDDRYYILKDGNYHGFKTYRGLLAVYKSRRGEIRRHLRKKNIRFKADPETAIIEATNYFATLN